MAVMLFSYKKSTSNARASPDPPRREGAVYLQQVGVEEAEKETAKKEELDKTKLERLVGSSNRIIAKASSVFPFELFPTTIIVEDTRITVIYRSFFAIAEQHTVDIKDVTNVFVGNGPIFGYLEIVSGTFIENNMYVRRLWRKDAIKIRNTIEGLRTITRQHIDATNIEKDELLKGIEKINKTAITI